MRESQIEDFRFFRSHIFIVTIAAQMLALLLLTFGNLANIIQYLSGFGVAYVIADDIDEKQNLIHAKQDQLDEQLQTH